MDGDILGVNKRYYPTQLDIMNPLPVTVVLVAGAIGDYAAYSGVGAPEWVARFGDKLSFKEATCHFPIGLEEDKYRT